MLRWVRVSLLLLLGGLVLRPAIADEPPPQAPAGDPPAQAAEDQGTKETKPPDLGKYLATLREQLEAHKTAPARTELNTGLFDAWRAILHPRAGSMILRIKNLQDEDHWAGGGKDEPLHVRPGSWSRFTRELAALYTQLGGALRGYEQFRPKVKRPVSSFRGEDREPPDTGDPIIGLDIATLENQMIGQISRGQPVSTSQLYSYWGMIERYYDELEKRREERRKWEERQQRKKEKMEEIWAEVTKGIEFQKQSLELQMISVRGLTGTLQATEELRLQEAARALPAEDERRAALEALLDTMREHRQSAETFTSSSTAGYGTLLRKWLATQKKALALLSPTPGSGPDPAK